MANDLSRRTFLATAAVTSAGLTLRFNLGPGPGEALAATSFDPNTALTITPDGLVTVHITKAEMGQGVGTALAQIVAEELEADWKDIRIDYPVADPKFGLMLTGGSWSVNWTFDTLSRAGAAARIMLVDAAAKRWDVRPEDCVAERGTVRHLLTGRAMSYGDIVAKVPITKTMTEDDLKKIQLKKPSEYKVVGKWVQRLDIPDKTNGRAKFGMDTFLPNMVYAKVAYPPTREGSTVTAVDDSAAKKVKGYIRTVVVGDLVAVVADRYENAVKARDALKVTWNPGPNANVSTESIFADYARKAKEDTRSPSWVEEGDVRKGMADAVTRHEATYMTDFVAHMQMEPMNCVAALGNDGSYDLYTGTQFQTMALGALAKTLGVPETKIRIHQHYLGGGFGRRLEPDVMVETALIAREVKRPVKLIRSREEDLRRDYYRSATLQVVKAGLDKEGRVIAWDNTIVAAYPGERYGGLDDKGRDQFALNGADHVYEIPNQFVRAIRGETGMSVGYVRAVAPNYTFFAVETFVDELAHLAKKDPVEYRLSMLGSSPRLARVLKLAADRAGWGKPLPANVGRGVACVTAQEKKSPTWTASVVEAEVDPATGKVRVRKITSATDCGIIVNPDGARAQIEGSLIFGISNALKEQGTVKDGQLVQSNFHDYQVLRMNEVPEIEVHVIESTEYPTGLGEPGTTTIAPALSNAIFAATGARVRSVPLLPERVLKAIQSKA
jgi:isoquinoline 1-oxidoreductase subunit beta